MLNKITFAHDDSMFEHVIVKNLKRSLTTFWIEDLPSTFFLLLLKHFFAHHIVKRFLTQEYRHQLPGKRKHLHENANAEKNIKRTSLKVVLPPVPHGELKDLMKHVTPAYNSR